MVLGIIDQFGAIHCSVLIGKSRISPLKFVSIPRLELTTATLSIKMSKLIRNELEIEDFEETFSTDSRVVLGYIKDEVKRFKIFVANKIQIIKENFNVNQWEHISTKYNPADDGSRGLYATNFNKVTHWFSGPEFLWQPEAEWGTLTLILKYVTVMILKFVITWQLIQLLFKKMTCWAI